MCQNRRDFDPRDLEDMDIPIVFLMRYEKRGMRL
jgi:hypothetical protein